MTAPLKDLSRLCVHTLTTRPWGIDECVRQYAARGIRGITVWRNVLENKDLSEVKKLLDDFGMEVVSLARGGFFPAADLTKRAHAIDDNLWAIEQAASIGAPLIVLVCGADGSQPLEKSRAFFYV